MMRTLFIGLAVLVAATAAYLAFDWYRWRHAGEAFGAPFVLVDQRGAEITERAFQGQPTAVFFGFTHCPEICPTTLFEMDGWLAQLGPETSAVKAYFVTIDPERDTAEVMDRYVSNVSQHITGITGEPDKVAAMARSFGIYVNRVELEGGDYTMDHTASVLLLNRRGDFFGTIAYGENPDTALQKLRRLAREG